MLSIDEKYSLALDARLNSYSPYSNFKVGALCILENDTVIKGCNIENMSYGLTNCAERSAIFNTISHGYNYKDIKEIVIIADTEKPVSPCGACRQVMAEFLKPNTIVTMFNLNKEYLQMTINELLPYSFDKGDLDDK